MSYIIELPAKVTQPAARVLAMALMEPTHEQMYGMAATAIAWLERHEAAELGQEETNFDRTDRLSVFVNDDSIIAVTEDDDQETLEHFIKVVLAHLGCKKAPTALLGDSELFRRAVLLDKLPAKLVIALVNDDVDTRIEQVVTAVSEVHPIQVFRNEQKRVNRLHFKAGQPRDCHMFTRKALTRFLAEVLEDLGVESSLMRLEQPQEDDRRQ